MLRFEQDIQLSLVTGEVLQIPLSASVKAELESLGCYEVHLLHDNHAIAINYTNKPLDRSLKGDEFKAQLEIQGRVNNFLEPLYEKAKRKGQSLNPQPFELLRLGTPDPRFEIHARIPRGEVDGSPFLMGSYFMKHWEPMVMRIFFNKKASASDQSATFELIRQWHMAATNTGFGCEIMQPGELRIASPFTTRKGLL